MRAFLFNDGKAAELPFAEGAVRFGEAGLVWLHLDGRNDAARSWLAAQDDIPSVARAALTASETRPRADVMAHGVLINLRGLGKTPDDDPDALVSIRCWAEEGRVVSLSYRTPVALDAMIDRFLGGEIADPGDLLSNFADATTDALDPDVAELGDALDACETDLDRRGIYEMRRNVSATRARAIAYRRFVAPQRQALERLAAASFDWFDDDDRLHLRDAADRAARMAEELEAVRERAALMHEELTDLRAEQMDARALWISVVAFIFLPLTFITGLLGMNVEGIPYADRPWAFWGVTILCFVVGLVVLAYFVRRHWISRN
jgi:zinc transporter